MNRRIFLGAFVAATCLRPHRIHARTIPVKFRRANPYKSVYRYIDPAADEYACETDALELKGLLERMLRTDEPAAIDGWKRWRASLGHFDAARVFVLPGDRVRFEIKGRSDAGLTYRVTECRCRRSGQQLSEFAVLAEDVATAHETWFEDVTAHALGGTPSFQEQLRKGMPYWRSRLDLATGIDIYGNNGVAVGDIDNDGWDEIYVCQPGGLPNRLYKNNGDATFRDITETSGVGVLDDTSCALFLDLRNSGKQDLIVLTSNRPLLFLNDGSGRFTHRMNAFRFETPPRGTFTGMAAADYDRNGRIDLYLCCYVYFQSEDQYQYPLPYHDARNGPPNFLFRNDLDANGNGSFTDATAESGLNENNDRYSFAPAWCDFNGDGWPDLYVANDFGRNNLYVNRGGRFHDGAAEAGVEDLGPGMSAAWFDYDGDGRPDLYVANMWSDAGQRIVASEKFPHRIDVYRRHSKGNSLYRNRGDGHFEETGAKERVEAGRWAWSSDAHDFDNDGSAEIFITCGMLTNWSEKDLMSFFWRQVVAKSPAEKTQSQAYETGWNAINQLIRGDYSWSGREPNVFFARRGDRYRDYSGVSGLDVAEDGRAFAVTDLDGDGNLDVVLKSRLGSQVRVFRNRAAQDRHAIAFELCGTKSNRDAIGARVAVDGQVKWVQAGSGYISQHTKRLHFGTGTATSVRDAQVTWPSGVTQNLSNLECGFVYTITEGSDKIVSRAFRKPRPTAAIAVAGENGPAHEPVWLLDPVPLPDKHEGPGVVLLTAGGEVAGGLDLSKDPDLAAGYTIFRRYLLDYRAELELPAALLIDERSRVHRFYPTVPSAATIKADLATLRDGKSTAAALPFAGKYYGTPTRSFFKLGIAYLWAGYPQRALPYLEEATRRTPNNHKILETIAQIYLESGHGQTARPFVERALAIDPNSAAAWNNLGGVEAEAGNARRALECYERALAIRPDLTYALVNAGQTSAKLGDTAKAEGLLRRAVELAPQDAEAANQLGLVYAKQERSDEARELFKKAIRVQRDHAGAINNLAVLYMKMGQAQDAIAAFRYGLEVAPADDTLYFNLARVYAQLGQADKARAVLRKLLDIQPGHQAAAKAMRELENL